jgi:hypothetical protein
MPLISSDHSLNTVSTLKRVRPTSCPYIENFGKFLKEKYEMDNRIFKRGLARMDEIERRHAEIDRLASDNKTKHLAMTYGPPKISNVVSIGGF